MSKLLPKNYYHHFCNLAKEVRKFHCLYEKVKEDYRGKNKKRNDWNETSKELDTEEGKIGINIFLCHIAAQIYQKLITTY